MSTKEHDKALNKAKIHLMTDISMVFFTTVCLMLTVKWDDKIPTLAVDGKSIFINPKFFMGLTPQLRASALLHETLHVALMHVSRVMGRDKKKWNYAADYVVNDILVEAGYPIEPGWYHDINYRGLSTGEVYDIIPAPPEDYASDILDPNGDPDKLTTEVKEMLVTANTIAQATSKDFGNLPGEVQFFLDSLIAPKLPWHRILRSYFSKMAKTDYSFRKPNRRFFPEHLIPSQHSEAIVDITVAVDTSCSVSDDQFKQFVSETSGIIRNLKPTKLHFVQFDTSIHKVTELRSVSELGKLGFVGRGGTDIHPVMDWANKNNPEVLLIFTDGYFSMPHTPPKCNVIWVINDNPSFTAPFGKVIHFDMREAA